MNPMIPPTVRPGGTDKLVLVDCHVQDMQKLDDVANAMAQIMPNGRDYILSAKYDPSGLTREVLAKAMAAWQERFDMISAIRRDIEKVAIAINDQP